MDNSSLNYKGYSWSKNVKNNVNPGWGAAILVIFILVIIVLVVLWVSNNDCDELITCYPDKPTRRYRLKLRKVQKVKDMGDTTAPQPVQPPVKPISQPPASGNSPLQPSPQTPPEPSPQTPPEPSPQTPPEPSPQTPPEPSPQTPPQPSPQTPPQPSPQTPPQPSPQTPPQPSPQTPRSEPSPATPRECPGKYRYYYPRSRRDHRSQRYDDGYGYGYNSRNVYNPKNDRYSYANTSYSNGYNHENKTYGQGYRY